MKKLIYFCICFSMLMMFSTVADASSTDKCPTCGSDNWFCDRTYTPEGPRKHTISWYCNRCEEEKSVTVDCCTCDASFEKYEYLNPQSHAEYYTCCYCKRRFYIERQHYGWYYYGDRPAPTYHDSDTHYVYQKCDDCYAFYPEEESHSYYWQEINPASISRDGKEVYKCYDCGHIKETKTYKWSANDSQHSLKYDFIDEYWVCNNSKTIKVLLNSSAVGTTLKVTIGKKTYTRKITSSARKYSIKIKTPKAFSKVKYRLYYKGKLIASLNDVVVYPKIRKGMTKKQVKNTKGWICPNDTASASGGWSYFYYKNGSYVAFKNGKVNYWYKH